MSESVPTSDSRQRVAVIGAGITGLTTAYRLLDTTSDVHVDVFEASGRTGGAIFTEHRDGFIIEHGPDSFITNKPGGLRLCEDLGISDQLVGAEAANRRSLVLHRGKPQPVPDGFMLMAPARPMSILTTPILSLAGKARLLSEYFRPARTDNSDESLASFVRRRFGAETLDRLVQPLVGGIYTSDPEQLSLKATLPRFIDLEQQYGSVIRGTLATERRKQTNADSSGSGARYGLFATTADGLSSLINTLEQKLTTAERGTLHLNTPIQAVRSLPGTDQQWQLEFADSQTEPQQYDTVILTTPAWVSAQLLANTVDSDFTDELNAIEYASSAIVVSAHKLSDFQHPLDAFGLVIPAVENRRILAVSFGSRKFPGRAPDGQILLRTFVGGAMQPELFDLPDDEVLNLVDEELRDILGMNGQPLFRSVARHTRAMPQYHVGHLERGERIRQHGTRYPGLEFAGNAFGGVGLPDSIASGYETADRVAESADTAIVG